MISIPDRLLGEDFVDTLHHSPQLVFLQKSISLPVTNRKSFVSMHAISMVREGVQVIKSEEGEVISIQKGELGLLQKGIYSVTDILPRQGTFDSFHIFFGDELLKEMLAQFPHASSPQHIEPFFHIPSNDYLPYFIQSVEDLRKVFKTPGTALHRLKLLELFTALSSAHPDFGQQLAGLSSSRHRNLMAFMEEHYDKPMSIQDYAFLTGRSPSTFRREFKTRFGVSPRKWIIRKRMEKAKSLLEKRRLSVTDTAFEVGYENLSHFISEFKKAFGYTPGQQIGTL